MDKTEIVEGAEGGWKMLSRKVAARVVVKNVPEITIPGFMVARQDEGDLWYYGTYTEQTRAEKIAQDLGNGVVLEIL